MKKLIALVLTALLAVASVSALADITIAVPNDATNEGRALLLLQTYGYLTLSEDAGITATALDVIDNPLNIKFYEVEAAFVPNTIEDPGIDYAIINNNYALDYGLNPATQGLLIEDANSPYVNVISVRADNVDSDLTKALVAAVSSQAVADYIAETYPDGSVVCTLENLTDGYDETVDYDALAGQTITIAATPVPHEGILQVAKEILAAKGITLDIQVFTDYVTPNEVVEAGDVYANFFAHQPYQDNFNEENGTHLVTVLGVHVEPMAIYGAVHNGVANDLSILGEPKTQE